MALPCATAIYQASCRSCAPLRRGTPSVWWESYCLTAREGALAGLPVVASRLAGLAEAVDEGLALGFDAGNAAQLAEVIAQLCDNEDLRDEMTRKAHLVRDINDCVDQIHEVYQTVLTDDTNNGNHAKV